MSTLGYINDYSQLLPFYIRKIYMSALSDTDLAEIAGPIDRRPWAFVTGQGPEYI